MKMLMISPKPRRQPQTLLSDHGYVVPPHCSALLQVSKPRNPSAAATKHSQQQTHDSSDQHERSGKVDLLQLVSRCHIRMDSGWVREEEQHSQNADASKRPEGEEESVGLSSIMWLHVFAMLTG